MDATNDSDLTIRARKLHKLNPEWYKQSSVSQKRKDVVDKVVEKLEKMVVDGKSHKVLKQSFDLLIAYYGAVAAVLSTTHAASSRAGWNQKLIVGANNITPRTKIDIDKYTKSMTAAESVRFKNKVKIT